jgi:hypothetical protein
VLKDIKDRPVLVPKALLALRERKVIKDRQVLVLRVQ